VRRMHSIHLTGWLGLAATLAATTAGAETSQAGSEPRRLNILWIGVDQMRYDTPGCNGNAVCRTANIDKLFGDWENLSGQFEASAPVTGNQPRQDK
jgi:hypothetical protein